MRGRITKSDSEKVIGEDSNRIPIIECPPEPPVVSKIGAKMIGKQWYKCPECLNECFHEVNGKVYYHKLSCSKSNGIGYGDERAEKAPKVKWGVTP